MSTEQGSSALLFIHEVQLCVVFRDIGTIQIIEKVSSSRQANIIFYLWHT